MLNHIIPAGYFSREEERTDYLNYETYTKPFSQALQAITSRISGMSASSGYDEYEIEAVVTGVVLLTALMVSAVFLKTSKVAHKPKSSFDLLEKVALNLEVDFKTSANKGLLTIRSPQLEQKSVEVNFAFCIDRSQSMETRDQQNNTREAAVKKGLKKVIKKMQKIQTEGNARFHVSVTGFNHVSKSICPITEISSEQDTDDPAAKILKAIKNYKSRGETSIGSGLAQSSAELIEMKKRNPAAKNVLVLLSDGQDDIPPHFNLQDYLEDLTPQIFSIGIGNQHNRKTLKGIAQNALYFDTTKNITIVKAISETFTRSLDQFSALTLRANGLPAGKWGIIDGNISDENSSVKLDPMIANELTKNVAIEVYGEQLETPLDLRQVAFELDYNDPKGISGKINFSWNPDTILDPEILKCVYHS